MKGSSSAFKIERATSPNVQENLFSDMARCDLTQEELQDLAREMADDQLELERLEGEKASVTKSYGSRIESVKARIREKSGTFRQGWEMREVEHVEVKDFDLGTCTLLRMDTGEVVKSRKLTRAELDSKASRLPIEVPDNEIEQ
jgi:arginine deiminase